MSNSDVLGADTVEMMLKAPAESWAFAQRMAHLQISPAEARAVASITPDKWLWLVGEVGQSPAVYEAAARTWNSGRMTAAPIDQDLVENEIRQKIMSDTAIAAMVLSALAVVAGIVMAIIGLIAAILGVMAAGPTGGLTLAAAVVGLITAIVGLVLAVCGIGGIIVSIIALVASYMPDNIVRAVGTQMAGGRGGSPFADNVSDKGALRAIKVRYGALIDALQFTWDNPNDPNSPLVGVLHGGGGGDETTIPLAAGEVLQKISGRAGDKIDQLTFHTNVNRYGPYGGNGGTPFELTPEYGARIVGIQGRSGALLDAIGGLSEIYGSAQAGGMGGTPFLDRIPADGRLSRISIRAGSYVDSIQVHHMVAGAEVSGRAHGAEGGSRYEIDLKPTEVIDRVHGRHGAYVDRIGFDIRDTTTGATRTETFGGGGGDTDFSFAVPLGKKLTGFWGRSGDYLDSVGICVG